MLLNQRDVVEVEFNFPDGDTEVHPVIVLSVQGVSNVENTFIGVPISHSEQYHRNKYSFPIDNNDFINNLKYSNSHVRLHLLSVISIKDIFQKRKLNEMTRDAFNAMFDQILELIFGCE